MITALSLENWEYSDWSAWEALLTHNHIPELRHSHLGEYIEAFHVGTNFLKNETLQNNRTFIKGQQLVLLLR
jgi:hypothetical protein